MLDSPSPITGEVLPCPELADEQRDSPWVVYMLRNVSSKWKPIARMASNHLAWEHCNFLQQQIPTASFDVVFEGPVKDGAI
jgi:hypothetical protein